MTNLTEKPDILSLFPEELTQFVRSIGEKDFRAKQLYGWMQKGAAIAEMSKLPAAFPLNTHSSAAKTIRSRRHRRWHAG